MTNPIAHTAVLTCHPGARGHAVRKIEARVCWTEGGALAFSFVLKGDLNRLRVAPPGPARRAERLWEHTCFEAFVSLKGQPAYHEFNFAPSGEWAVYAFRRYRESMPLPDVETAPIITARSAVDKFELDAVVGLESLPAIMPHAALRVGLCAVIKEKDGTLSYWALDHPAGRPDFHHPDAFALELKPPPAKPGGAP